MNLATFVKLGYAMVLVTLILMFWTSMVRMHEMQVQYPPCYFNMLCTCSKATPDLGIVACINVPMPRLPQPINSSKVFMLQLEDNGLRSLQPHFLSETGLYRLHIKHNPLADIPDEAFIGLEWSLWELELPYNRLVHVPSRSFRHLKKLRLLDLTGNQITTVASDNWRGLENCLQILRLGRNSIDKLPPDAFGGLSALEVLDLRGNSLREIDVSIFRDGMISLSQLYLNDNQMTHVPYAQLASLNKIRVLDLSYNHITKIVDPRINDEIKGLQMNLDVLRLDYNQIDNISSKSFEHFYKVNKTYLDGNPLSFIEKGTFRDSRIRELYFRDCDLLEVDSADFAGLETSLEVLDISGNNITELPSHFFKEFDMLRTLYFRENRIHDFAPEEVFSGFQYSLYNLDLSGKQNGVISLRDLRQMRNLRYLSISRLPQPMLTPEDFLEFGMDVRELRITRSNLNAIKSHAFIHVRGIKHLDFSENAISTIDDDAFSEVGHSLLTLKMSHALTSSFGNVPSGPLRSLTNLQHLDLSNNKIQTMPDTSFHFLKRIRRIELQDNEINTIHKGTFQGNIHSELEEINLSFNRIKHIEADTFVDLASIIGINLEDNEIDRVERRAFMNMKSLKYINLRGNKITVITDEAFQNLQDMEFLDVAYNKLQEFDFASFDQVGTLSSFKVNASHNSIPKLWINSTTFSPPTSIGGNVQSNIRILDFSYNNISDIMRHYFKPTEFSLTHLYLSHNQLINVTQGVFGNMPNLQWLDLSHNDLREVDFDCFRNTKNLQVLLLSWNDLAEVPVEAFKSLRKLRILDLSHNKLRSLPDNLFPEGGIESLDLSHNQFTRLPIKIMSLDAAASLSVLDMSWNFLTGVHNTDALFRLRALTWLDLSYNRLVRLDDGVFSDLSNLIYLDLSHNKPLTLESRGKTFYGLENTLLTLGLSNISLQSVPELPLRHLRTLYLSRNDLSFLPPEMSSNLSSLRHLDLSHNELTQVPLITHTLPELRTFNLGYNPITIITNTSFLGVAASLENLDIRSLSLAVFEAGALCKASKLRTLFITVYTGVKNFNLPNILEYNHGLRELYLDIQNETTLEKEMKGNFPTKLQNITLSGKELRMIGKDIFRGIRHPHLHFALRNTSVSTVPRELFEHAEWVRNVTADLRGSDVRTFHNPSSGYMPAVPGKRFLLKLRIAGNHLDCDCDIGWIEMWQRKHRQYREDRCGSYLDYNHEREEDDEFNCWDNGWDDDLRETFCVNKNNMSLLQALKDDIECGWGGASSLDLSKMLFFSLVTAVLVNVH